MENKIKTSLSFSFNTLLEMTAIEEVQKRNHTNLVEVLVSQEFEKLPADVKKAAKSPAAIKELKEKLEKKKKG